MPKKHLYLPKLLKDASIDEPVSNALWEDKQKRIVLAISDGIELDESAPTRGVSSIPDIYARPLTFLGALRSEKHPLRKRVVQEWRGLLSLLALHRVKSDLGNLTITPVTLNDEKFSQALINLAPKSITLEKNGTAYSWTDLLLIRFNRIPIGAFSPATLVYTSSDYSDKLGAFSLKDDQGFLKPPGKSEGLEYVGQWLEWFIKQFNIYALSKSNSSSGDHQYVSDINKLLDEWMTDIRKELEIGSHDTIYDERVRISEEYKEFEQGKQAPFIANYNIYKTLLKPLVKNENIEGVGGKSQYGLSMSRNKSSYKEVVIIEDRQLALNKNLWDRTRPKELDKNTAILIEKFFKSASGQKINNINLENDHAVWIRPELFFLSNTLLKAKSGDTIFDTKKGKDTSEGFMNAGFEYILPFKNEILQFFSPVNIHEILKPSFKESEGKVTFSFFLPIQGNQKVEVSKVYRLKGADKESGEGQIIEKEVPVLEIFPNYMGDFWCQYFMLCSDTETFMMEPLNYEHASTITRKEQKFDTAQSSQKAEIVRISGYNSFPEAIGLRPKNNPAEYYGIILLSRDPDIEQSAFDDELSIVGIDFGTSNTNIYVYRNNEPRKLKLELSKYIRSVLNSPETKTNELSQQFFLPNKDQELAIPTALRIFNAGVNENLLLDYFIYFPNDYKYPKNVYTNFKWETDDSKMNSFIRSIIFLILIDLIRNKAGKVEFKCTFPKSFSESRRIAYSRIWAKTLMDNFKFDTDVSVSRSPECIIYIEADENRKRNLVRGDELTVQTKYGNFHINTLPEFVAEGESSGHYFSSAKIVKNIDERANMKYGAVCIDVGGGTTDYSVWYENNIVYDCSVNLAGSQLSNIIRNNPRVWPLLFSNDAVVALESVGDNDSLFSSRLNYILRKEDAEIGGRLIKFVNNKDLAWLRRTLAIEFCALSFYAGHICLAIDDFTGGKSSTHIKNQGIRLHWGGNAAKFINWIDFGKYDPNGMASKLLNGMFFNAIVDPSLESKAFRPALLKQVQSPRHKDEASGGVVVMNNYRDRSNDSSDESETPVAFNDDLDYLNLYAPKEQKAKMEGYVVGEKISVKGIPMEHYNLVTKEKLFSNGVSNIDTIDLKQFKVFVDIMNKLGKMTGLFPEGSQIVLSNSEEISIRGAIISKFDEQAAMADSKRSIQPVFILAVNHLLDILSNKMK